MGLVLASFASFANCAMVDFEDLPTGSCKYLGDADINSGGFQFSGSAYPNSALFSCKAGVVGSNTSSALINANDTSNIMMYAPGEHFDLFSFNAGARYFPTDQGPVVFSSFTATGVLVTGWTDNGTLVVPSVSQSFQLPGLDFAHFVLGDDFRNLVFVTFGALGGDRPEFLLDDVNARLQSEKIPEPGSMALVLIAVVGLGAAARRQKAVPFNPSAGYR